MDELKEQLLVAWQELRPYVEEAARRLEAGEAPQDAEAEMWKRWAELFAPEIASVQRMRNRVVHGDDVEADDLAVAIAAAVRLKKAIEGGLTAAQYAAAPA